MIGPTTEDGRVTTMETLSVPTYGILNRSIPQIYGYVRLDVCRRYGRSRLSSRAD